MALDQRDYHSYKEGSYIRFKEKQPFEIEKIAPKTLTGWITYYVSIALLTFVVLSCVF